MVSQLYTLLQRGERSKTRASASNHMYLREKAIELRKAASLVAWPNARINMGKRDIETLRAWNGLYRDKEARTYLWNSKWRCLVFIRWACRAYNEAFVFICLFLLSSTQIHWGGSSRPTSLRNPIHCRHSILMSRIVHVNMVKDLHMLKFKFKV